MPKDQPGSSAKDLPIPVELIERRIYLMRGQKVMLDADLASLYHVGGGSTAAFDCAPEI